MDTDMGTRTIPPEVIAELTQILSNLVLGDNEIRLNAEKAVNERLAHTPDMYFLALAQYAITADTDVMRSFALVLLRRLLFRPYSPSSSSSSSSSPLYDHISPNTLSTLESLLLHCLSLAPSSPKCIDTICDIATAGMNRGRPWPALQETSFALAQSPSPASRASAFRIWSTCPNLIADLHPPSVLQALTAGLTDSDSTVLLEAVHAAVAFLVAHNGGAELMRPLLETLPNTPKVAEWIQLVMPLAQVRPALFAPHLGTLLGVLSRLVRTVDCGPTPTMASPYPLFQFPPVERDEEEGDEEHENLRRAVVEFMLTLSESKPSMVKHVPNWIQFLIHTCLEGLSSDSSTLYSSLSTSESSDLTLWLDADPTNSTSPSEDAPYEQSLDRLACALPSHLLPLLFQLLPSLLASHNWRERRAALLAIAATAEGTHAHLVLSLPPLIELISPPFTDPHPRVRHAACQCLGQLCTDLEQVIQSGFHNQLLSLLIPALDDPEARVHAHATAALVNFCEGVERGVLVGYLDVIVGKLGRMMCVPNQRGYVREQAITTLAMVADASERDFGKYYGSIMPLLFDILRNGGSRVCVKTMECAGLVAIAVGREMFAPDADAFVQILLNLQNNPPTPPDPQLTHYLTATWAKVCQALGPAFAVYLPAVMPSLLETARAGADISVLEAYGDGRDILPISDTVGLRTASLDEKCQAFETLVIYASTLCSPQHLTAAQAFASYIPSILPAALTGLTFYFHEGVREACAMLLPMIMVCATLTSSDISRLQSEILLSLARTLSSEHDISFVASLCRAYGECVGVYPRGYEHPTVLMPALKRQLGILADHRRRRIRAREEGEEEEEEEEDAALLQEMEDFTLEDMGRMLRILREASSDGADIDNLLVAVGSVRELGR